LGTRLVLEGPPKFGVKNQSYSSKCSLPVMTDPLLGGGAGAGPAAGGEGGAGAGAGVRLLLPPLHRKPRAAPPSRPSTIAAQRYP
jgi:hypothetical protein